MSNWGTIALGCRIGERADPLFVRSWQNMIASGLRKGDGMIDPAVEMPHHFAANYLAKLFLKSDANTLCMVDSDMIFSADTLSKLRDNPEGAGYGTLSPLCTTRRNPYVPVVLTTKGKSAWTARVDLVDGSLVQVDATCVAFALIRRQVFLDIDEKFKVGGWFFDWGPQGYGEDTTFSDRARACGYKIGIDTGIQIGHRGSMTFGWDVEKKQTVFSDYNQVKLFTT